MCVADEAQNAICKCTVEGAQSSAWNENMVARLNSKRYQTFIAWMRRRDKTTWGHSHTMQFDKNKKERKTKVVWWKGKEAMAAARIYHFLPIYIVFKVLM